jgi:hypothetical protein
VAKFKAIIIVGGAGLAAAGEIAGRLASLSDVSVVSVDQMDEPTPTDRLDIMALAAREVDRSFRDLEIAAIELADVIDIDPVPFEYYPGPVLSTRPRIVDNAERSGANDHKARAVIYKPASKLFSPRFSIPGRFCLYSTP